MIGWGVKGAVLLRALAVQGSWNYETLTGTGFGFALLPALRVIYGKNPAGLEEAVRRHEGPFNSHPYLAPLALGAVIRLEEDGENPDVIERFKTAVRGSLGTLGDQLVWAGVRPLCLLLAMGLVLLGAPWWWAVVAFLCLYNAAHVGIMLWGFNVGYSEGLRVAERLRHAVMSRVQPHLNGAGAFAAGVVIALVLFRGVPSAGEPGWIWAGLALAAVMGGAFWGTTARRVGVAGAALLALVGLLAGVLG